MRVLHVYRTFFPDSQGGLEETIRQICLATQSEGVECRVFALSRDPQPNPVTVSGIPVYQAHLDLEVASCGISFRCRRVFQDAYAWADLIHYHFPWPFGDLLHLTTGPRKPSIVTYHSDIVRQRLLGHAYRPLMNRFLSSIDRVVCTSPNYFATSDTLSRFQHKVEVIPIGIDETTYPSVTDAEISATERSFGSGFFLFIGVFRYYKGLHILLEAMKDAPYRVVIAGSGPTEASLRAQAATLGLDNVIFAGQVSDAEKVALLHLCAGIVFPSYLRSEAFGITLLEGAMFGRPLVSTEVGSGTSHVNIDKETGYVVSPGSSRSLRHALDQLHTRPDVARIMGVKARRRFEQLFTGRRMGVRYAALYRQILGLPEDSHLPIARAAISKPPRPA
ncbi:MAG: glycosyltransferase [Pseudomonadales bacterium]